MSNQTSDPKQTAPITQDRRTFLRWVPEWMKQMPYLRFPQPQEDFKLIQSDQAEQILATANPTVAKKIQEDIEFLDKEVLRFFRERDYEASRNQNRYRLYQICFIGLATLATFVGSLQAQSLSGNPGAMPVLAFIETVIALLSVFLATISGRESPLLLWLTNRRRAESLRREYFRYLMNIFPYDVVDGFKRRTLLAQRAADINRGVFPDEKENH